MDVKDSNGTLLADGDSVLVNKTLKVKGSQINLKMGTVIKNIRLTESPDEVECRVDKSIIVLKTMYLKKKN
jgi:protein PhnA